MIWDIKTGSQSTSPSLIILRQSLFMLKLLQNKQDQTGETTDSPLHLMSALDAFVFTSWIVACGMWVFSS